MENTVTLTAIIRYLSDIRYTPAGLPVLQMKLEHASEQIECGQKRIVKCEISAKLMGPQALDWQYGLESSVKVKGFLACRSFKNPNLVLHIQHIEHLKG